MNAFRIVWPLFAALVLCHPAAKAANHDVSVTSNSFTPEDLTVQLGDTVTFRNSGGGLHNAVSDPGSPVMFRCANGCSGDGGNGNASASNWTAVVTMDAAGLTRYFCEIHGGPGGAGMSGSIMVVGAPADPPSAIDDLVRLRLGGGPSDIDVLANDFVDNPSLAGGELSIVQAPVQGVAVVVDGGNAGTVADDVVRYTLPAGSAVDTTLAYRVCDASARCSNGDLRILARGLHDDDLALESPGDGGFADVALTGLPALPEARFETTALAQPARTERPLALDASPENPWDGASGLQSVTYTIPVAADGLPRDWGVVADAVRLAGTDVDLYMGPDLDGDGGPDVGEIRCTSAMSASAERCELRITHPGSGVVRYWVAMHNPSATAGTGRLDVAQAQLRPGDARLVATGPGHLPATTTSAVRIGWHEPGIDEGEIRYAFVRVRPTPASDLGWTPLRIDRTAGDHIGLALVSGRDQALRTLGAHERLYIDVPAGATSLTVTATSAGDYDVYLARRATITPPAIEAAPPRSEAVASGTVPGNENVVVVPPLLQPGRWYVTPVNAGFDPVPVTIRATIAGAAPIVRSGSYFNPDRSGHGMFVYPAADQLAILWYHYFEDGSPTWYYLQGLQPAANGAWSSPVYRSAWDGDSNVLTAVGQATMTPSGPDAYTWSWTLDGRSGSEPLAALGRGCPTVDGIERDSSSTWFDPATAGTGYSVQLFPNAGTAAGYEYNAAFVYDGHGRPRYLAAELPVAGAAVATYDLEQLTGFCPLCARTGAPTRQAIGTYTRTFGVDGRLSRIEVDAIYAGGIPGAWTGDDTVQPLGGADTTQGCEP